MTKQHNLINILILLISALTLNACGGGGDGGTPANADTSVIRILSLAQVDEGSDGGTTPINFTVRLDKANTQDITLNYAIQDISTEGTQDIVSLNGILTIPAGATEVVLPIDIVADTSFELTETFTVTLSNPSNNAILDNNQATGTIVNDDAIPVTVSIVGIIPGDPDTGVTLPTAEFDLLIDLDAVLQDLDLQNIFGDLAYDVYYDDGFNFATLVSSGRLNISLPYDGNPFRISFQVPAGIGGLGLNGMFRFDFSLLNLTGQPVPEAEINSILRPIETQNVQNFTYLTVPDVSVFTDGATGERIQMAFTAALSEADGVTPASISTPITLNYVTVPNTALSANPATPDIDYVATSGSVTIPAGVTEATFNIEIIGDDEVEPLESFYVYLNHDSSEVVMVKNRAAGFINDDDKAADFRTISVSNAQINEGNTGTTQLQFEVTLDQPADTPVSFTYSTELDTIGGHPADLTDYQGITNASEEFATGEQSKTITVFINADNDPEYDETLLLRITSTSANSLPFAFGRGTILSDDPLVDVTIADVVQAEGAATETANLFFTVNLSAALQDDLIIDYNTLDGTATTADNDYTNASGSITIAAGDTSGTISVSVIGDNTPEPDENFQLMISSSSNAAAFTDNNANGVIVNDDSSGWSGAELVQGGSVVVWPRLAFGPAGKRYVTYRDASTIKSTVSTAPTVWSTPPDTIGTTHSNASVQQLVPHLAIDNNGDGVAVWRDENDIVSSSILTAGNWSAATTPQSLQASGRLNMAGNPTTGEAIMVWEEPANTGNNNFSSIRAGHYDRANGWRNFDFIENDDGHAYKPEIAMNSTGKTIAVFTQTNTINGTTDVLAYEFNGTAWVGPTVLDDVANMEIASNQKVAMNEAGDVAVVWQQNFKDTGAFQRASIFLNRYIAASAQWSGPILVETQDNFSTEKPNVAIDAAGNVFVVWVQETAAFQVEELLARRYDVALGDWSSAPVPIETEITASAVLSSQQVVADNEGNAIAIWVQNDGTHNNLRSARYSVANAGWDPADLLELSNDSVIWFGNEPEIVMDRVTGNAMAVWGDSNARVWSNRYTK